MGSTLCRASRRSASDPAGTPRSSSGIDGLYRKIVLNYAKQWTRYSADKSSPKYRVKNKKLNKNKIKKKNRKKPTISAPYPADPDRLEGDKWRYVILTRLDTEPPPERPPRTKRRRRESSDDGGNGGSGRWGSGRRRRTSYGRGGRRRPPRPGRPTNAVADRDVSAAELMELVMDAYRRRPVARSLSSPRTAPGPGEGAAEQPGTTVASPVRVKFVKRSCSWTRPWPAVRRTGLFDSVDRVGALVDSLLL